MGDNKIISEPFGGQSKRVSREQLNSAL